VSAATNLTASILWELHVRNTRKVCLEAAWTLCGLLKIIQLRHISKTHLKKKKNH